jgi:hypothetical protein
MALYSQLQHLPTTHQGPVGEPDPGQPTAVVLVGTYGGLGIHTVLNVFRSFPGHFKSLIFISVGVMGSGGAKGEENLDALQQRTDENLARYVALAHGLGYPARAFSALGTDAVDAAEKLCLQVVKEYPRSTYFAGTIIFQRERWFQWLLHNNTAFAVQKRLQWAGRTMVIIPARLR